MCRGFLFVVDKQLTKYLLTRAIRCGTFSTLFNKGVSYESRN